MVGACPHPTRKGSQTSPDGRGEVLLEQFLVRVYSGSFYGICYYTKE